MDKEEIDDERPSGSIWFPIILSIIYGTLKVCHKIMQVTVFLLKWTNPLANITTGIGL